MSKEESGGAGDAANTQDGAAGADAKKESLFEGQKSKKLIRIATVMAYMSSVSFVAVLLSAYYLFLWHPPNPRLLHHNYLINEPHAEHLIASPQINYSRPHLQEILRNLLLQNFSTNHTQMRKNVDVESFSAIDDSGNDDQINQSLVSLKYTLTQILRGRKNQSKSQIGKEEGNSMTSQRSTNFLHNPIPTLPTASDISGKRNLTGTTDYIWRNDGRRVNGSRFSTRKSTKTTTSVTARSQKFTTLPVIQASTNKSNVNQTTDDK
ncbi:uncharacterized protein inaF-D [Prorops nasuta]|uniref:uncharacterized protein inaF-D n=1 Tax=Prorops nasuta TaxID=863751 RepID=UPI0034CEF87D